MTPFETAQLYSEMGKLAGICNTINWDDADAKPIGQRQFGVAFCRAVEIARAIPDLPAPIPGADPDGFVWLTWRTESREFALEMHSDLLGHEFRWTVTRDGMKQAHSANELRDVIESLRATFGDTASTRSSLLWMPN